MTCAFRPMLLTAAPSPPDAEKWSYDVMWEAGEPPWSALCPSRPLGGRLDDTVLQR